MKKFFAFVFAFLFFILLPAWLALFNVKFHLLDAEFYKTALKQANFYEEAVDLAVDGLSNYLGEMQSGQEIEVAFISQDKIQAEIKDLAHQLISRDFLQKNIENFIDGTTLWLASNQGVDQLRVKLDIAEIKTKTPSILREKIQTISSEIPDCSPEQAQILMDKASQEGEISPALLADLDCLPVESKQALSEMIGDGSEFEGYLDQMFTNVPDQLDLHELIVSSAVTPEQLNQIDQRIATFREIYRWLVIGFWVLSGLMILFLLAIALLTKRSIRSMFKWLGLTIFIPSLIMTILVISSRLIIPFFIKNSAYLLPAQDGVIIPVHTLEAINSLISGLLAGFANKIMLPVFVLCGVGFALFIGCFFFKKKPKTTESVKPAVDKKLQKS